jgi:hypothetical protein
MGVELDSCLSRSTFHGWGNWELACGGLLSAFLLFGHRDIVEVAKSFFGEAAATLTILHIKLAMNTSEH